MSCESDNADVSVDFVFEAEELERVTVSFVELVLKLYPVQTECVQKALKTVHRQQHSKRHSCQEHEPEEELTKEQTTVMNPAGVLPATSPLCTVYSKNT